MKPGQPTASPPAGIHVGIIMDGNGRWATRQGRSRAAGHRAGSDVVRRMVEAAPDLGIGTLTLFAFSADNWQRPEREVKWLMRLFSEYLRAEAAHCVAEGVRLTVLGRRDRLSQGLLETIDFVEAGVSAGISAFIITTNPDGVRDAVFESLERGVTLLHAEGGAGSPAQTAIRRFAQCAAGVDFRRVGRPDGQRLAAGHAERPGLFAASRGAQRLHLLCHCRGERIRRQRDRPHALHGGPVYRAQDRRPGTSACR